jgi:regulator of protease activity HflC (stomatin/prohibitin superfamily)
MTALLERLLDLLIQWFWKLAPFMIMGDDCVGLVRRFGVYKRDMRPGFNWKWPVVEEGLKETAALGSTTLAVQTLTTSDGKTVTVRGFATWAVIGAREYILGCDNAHSVINDVVCGVLAELVPLHPAADVLRGDRFPKEFRRAARERAKAWGVRIKDAGLVDRVEAQAFRLIGNAASDQNPSMPGG